MNIPEKITTYVNESDPFGPSSADNISDDECQRVLFDVENDLYRQFRRKPSIIIGRRGAGKTSFLNSTSTESGFRYIVEIKSSQAFTAIMLKMSKHQSKLLPIEEISELWCALIWNAIIYKIVKKEENNFHLSQLYLANMRAYVNGWNLNGCSTVDDIINMFLDDIIEESKKNSARTFLLILKKIVKSKISYESAVTAAKTFLESNKYKCCVVMDNMEEYEIEIDEIQKTVAGLLKAVGSFSHLNSNAQLRFCLPAELCNVIKEQVSRNPEKDFEYSVILHWSSLELIRIVAKRIQIYFYLYLDDIYKSISHINAHTGRSAFDIFNSLFGGDVLNGIGVPEKPSAYVLRHTQLLPRQIILIMNCIMKKSYNFAKDKKFANQAVLEGVRDAEDIISETIFRSYIHVHPNAREACQRCFYQLPIQFSYGEFHTVFNKTSFSQDKKRTFEDFVRMLVEIGAIGVVDRNASKSDRYVVGIFEYTEPGRLHVNSNDTLCIHPLFYRKFNVKYGKDSGMMTVYPRGVEVE